ncbi:MAG TPA: hypothetical protein VHJ18_00325 [Streptosporangiaceae bacterium]|nr:hypothetical protein [Streptosporangiaceae bacterium]
MVIDVLAVVTPPMRATASAAVGATLVTDWEHGAAAMSARKFDVHTVGPPPQGWSGDPSQDR